MNTYYLKKFRKKAYRQYRVIWDEDSKGEDIWRVKSRERITIHSYVWRAHYSKEAALAELKEFRREYVLDRAREIKHNRIYKKKAREYNKQLAKL